MKMSQEELNQILENHKKWLNDDESGVRANLRYADLSYADLSYANLSYADLSSADLRYANLRYANLSSADLSSANLSYADLDFSTFPLWCGSFDITVDKKLPIQIIYHICRMKCEDEEIKAIQAKLKSLANQFHKVKECGEIE